MSKRMTSRIMSIKLIGCAVKKIETKDGIELEIRPVDPESGKVVDKPTLRCYTKVDYLGNVSCQGVDCPKPRSCKKLTDGSGNVYCMCTSQSGDPGKAG